MKIIRAEMELQNPRVRRKGNILQSAYYIPIGTKTLWDASSGKKAN